MKVVTDSFKIDIKTHGRQFDIKLKINDTDFNADNLNSIKPSFTTPLFKTIMHQIELDSKVYMPNGTKVSGKIGVKVNEKKYEYIDLNTYYVETCERQEDMNSYRIIAYTKIKDSMIDYDLAITDKITVRNYLIKVCKRLGWDTKNIPATFINSEKLVNPVLHTGIDYTFRDALDEIATITFSFLMFKNDEFYLIYLTDTNETIDESYLDEDNITIGEKYFINALVFSRAEESDNIYRKDDNNIELNGLHEYRISDCQLLSTNDRADYIDEMFEYLKTLEFYIFDIQSKGILFLEACDLFNLKLNNVDYKVVLLNNEINIDDGLSESLYLDKPEETETEYKYADETDKKINQTYILVDKQNKKITQRVESVETTTLKNVEVQYALSDSTTVAPTSGWSTTAPEWQSEKYMWQKTISTYFNGRIIESEPTCIQGAKGERGLQGLQGDKGEQGIQGPKGDTGAKGDKGDTGAKGSTGAKGEKGDKGDTGDSGATTYFHIKYSPVENPTSSQMSETPNTYIGTYVDFIEEDSSDPTKYTWFQFKGSQGERGEKGIAGTNGTDGKTSYLHIAYANNSSGTSGFSVSDSTNKTYIGQYTDFEENDSTDPTKYSWTKIKGDTGSAGKGVKSVTNTYQAGSSGTTAPTGTWSTSIPETTADKPYLWTMTVTTYTDNTTSTAYAIGATPEGITVGGRNLFLNTGTERTNNDYNMAKYNPANEPLVAGEIYTASICVTPAKNVKRFGLYFSTGYKNQCSFYVEGNDKQVISKTFIMAYSDGKTPDDDIKHADASIYRFPNNETVTEESTIHWFKIEKGNKATDWTLAPEDIESSIEGVQTDANEALTSASNAQTIADKAMTAVDQLSRIISELVTDADGTSMMTQTSKGWTFNMSSITDNIEALRNGLDTLNNNQGSTSDLLYKIRDLVDSIDKKTAYINIGTDDNGNPCIELGKADNDFKVRITNTAIDFMEGSTKIAYANNNTFYVEKMIVKNELQIGESLGFVWRTRANGNLGLVPISQ